MNVGIDVGGTNLKTGLVDETGRIIAERRTPLGTFQGADEFARTLADLVRDTAAAAKAAPEQIKSVGMGIPGAVSDGIIRYTCNIPMENIPIRRLFQEHLKLPVLLGNDADCAAVGEYFCGAGRGTQNFIVVTLGTGVGGGLILNGKLYTGAGLAGEAGHMVTVQGGRLCNCGRRGCWETYASATGLIRTTTEAMERDPASLMHTIARRSGAVDGRTPFEAALQGDQTARQVCADYVDALAAGIINLVNVLHPERLAIGGGVAGAPDELLLEPLRRRVREESYSRHSGACTEILKAELGNSAGIIGAAMLDRAV